MSFVRDTLFLMANNTIGQSGKIYAMAAMMPFAMVPVDDTPLLSYALAHKSVNSSYTMTASNSDVYPAEGLGDVSMALMNGDPYTSAEQKQRDLYEINDTDWYSVSFEGVYSSSVCHLAMHQDWIQSKGYVTDGIVNMNLPEQGVLGPFKITSIKHILPQKKPVDEDPSDDYEYRPVTGLFIHHSDQVHNITFSNNETLGVTAPHPIFSTTHNDWRLAGELEVGEKVLTYHGEATVTNTEKKAGSEAVYNLEVKDLHNFLVSESGVVVHNTCSKAVRKQLDDLGVGTNNHRDMDIPKNRDKHLINKPGSDNVAQKFGKDKIEICFDDLGFPDFNDWVPDIPGKGKLEFPVNMFGNNDYGSGDYGQALSQLNSTLGTQFSKLENITLPGYVGVSWTFHHHQDGKTMQLVPSIINANTSHVGGKTIMKNARAKGVDHWLPGPGEIDQYRSLCK
jgi:hypothetical protein